MENVEVVEGGLTYVSSSLHPEEFGISSIIYGTLASRPFFNPSTATDSSNRKQPKVVFIVSTVNLVSQQKERFEAYLGDKYPVIDISGANATEVPLKYLLQSHNIVVLTAQMLVNALNNKSKEEQVNLQDISLLLFDECHHAHKEHSYNRIMERYLAFKKQPRHQGPLPQVQSTGD